MLREEQNVGATSMVPGAQETPTNSGNGDTSGMPGKCMY